MKLTDRDPYDKDNVDVGCEVLIMHQINIYGIVSAASMLPADGV